MRIAVSRREAPPLVRMRRMVRGPRARQCRRNPHIGVRHCRIAPDGCRVRTPYPAMTLSPDVSLVQRPALDPIDNDTARAQHGALPERPEEAMLRNVLLAVASLAFAGAGMADCDASHAAKSVITDDQAQATQPATKTAATPV